MITSISVENFRGIKSGRIEGLTDINILIGANGAGKSTLLEAVYLASAWAEPEDRIRNSIKFDVLVRRRSQRGNWSDFRKFLWYGMDISKNINISLSFKSGKATEFKIPHKSGSFPEDVIFLKINSEYVCPRGHPIEEEGITLGMTFDVREIYRTEEMKFLKGTELIDNMLYYNFELIERNVWPIIYGKRLDRKLIEFLKEGYEPDADSLTYIPITYTAYALMVGLSQTAVRIDDLGDGARTSLAITSILLTMENSVALVEDPEIHQHPAGLERLLSCVLEAAKSNNIQLFITTQSLDLIRILLSFYPSNCKIFALKRSPDGILKYREFALDEIEDLFESKIDIRKITEELWLEAS
ncbi:MAG: AAA family ATPase [Candidatus Methanodesulfokora sp.]